MDRFILMPSVTEVVSPIETKDGKVIFDTKQMVVGKAYRYMNKGKPYIAMKDKDNSIDIYRVYKVIGA